jgi:outer membrane protein OmpA-like peptidoglycan-associated protein
LFVLRFERDAVRPIAADRDRRVAGLADWLVARPQARLLVAGHTDALGDAAYNLALSRRRADAVARLLAAAGVPAGQLVVRGYGETAPLRQPSDPGLNRRVSFSLIGHEGCPEALSD